MELNKLKEQAEANAFKKLQSQFNSPEQLEQIEQHLYRNEKKKVFIFMSICHRQTRQILLKFFYILTRT
jgi:hypothetical protein